MLKLVVNFSLFIVLIASSTGLADGSIESIEAKQKKIETLSKELNSENIDPTSVQNKINELSNELTDLQAELYGGEQGMHDRIEEIDLVLNSGYIPSHFFSRHIIGAMLSGAAVTLAITKGKVLVPFIMALVGTELIREGANATYRKLTNNERILLNTERAQIIKLLDQAAYEKSSQLR